MEKMGEGLARLSGPSLARPRYHPWRYSPGKALSHLFRASL